LGQLAAILVIIFFLLFVADSRYRVLPNSLHNHLPSHHAGTVITDVSVAFCSSANPFSKCRLDPDQWHRVEKDLYLGEGWVNSAWLHVKRKKEEELKSDDKVVVGIRISKLDPGMGEKGQDKEKWESRSGGIWILRSAKRHDSDSQQVVTAIDVLFGADAVDPRPGWTLSPTPLQISAGDLPARLSIRHGQPHLPKESTPRVRKDGRFKILQVSDAHLSTGPGVCRDAIGPGNQPSTNCEADQRTLEFLESILEDEKPDLVILSGDQVEGPTAPDTQSTIFKLAAPLIERNIPYAAIFGNHDDEGSRSLSRAQQMALMQTLPYSLSQPGPEDVTGVGNYYLEILAEKSQHSALTIYLLDSHSLTPDERHYRGYDWIKQNQIDWFTTTAEGLKREHQKYSHIHMDMAFIHIPLPEYADKEHNKVTGGEWREYVTAPAYNSHFYDALVEHGIVAVGCGHDHVNDYCAINPTPAPVSATQHEAHKKSGLGPWMCYAGGSGFGGYAGYGGFHRRMRVWEVDANAGRMTTWTRVECCSKEELAEKHGLTVLVEGGVVVAHS
jgi:DNA repair exonuclease SbcCD nuclease subunit